MLCPGQTARCSTVRAIKKLIHIAKERGLRGQ
jgi:hypothetical protein